MILPGAVDRRPVPNKTPNGVSPPLLGVVMHITGSSYSAADGWFHNPSAKASAHLIIDLDGTIYQEVDFDDKAWAQASGNPSYYSFETAGTGGPLTKAQVLAFARAYAWLQHKDRFPFALAEAPGQRGLGWHGMGGVAWGGHPYCPGEDRKNQRPLILQLAQGQQPSPPSEEDMSKNIFITTLSEGIFVTSGPTQMRWVQGRDDLAACKNTGEVTDPNVYALPPVAFYARKLVGTVPPDWRGPRS